MLWNEWMNFLMIVILYSYGNNDWLGECTGQRAVVRCEDLSRPDHAVGVTMLKKAEMKWSGIDVFGVQNIVRLGVLSSCHFYVLSESISLLSNTLWKPGSEPQGFLRLTSSPSFWISIFNLKNIILDYAIIIVLNKKNNMTWK